MLYRPEIKQVQIIIENFITCGARVKDLKLCNAKEMKKLFNMEMYIFKLCMRTNDSRSDWQKKQA